MHNVSRKQTTFLERDLRCKTELLCWGLRSSPMVERIFKEQNPFDHLRTGNAGLQLIIGDNRLIANVPVGQKFCEQSPYSLLEERNGIWLMKGGSSICRCDPVPAPKWYLKKTSDGISMGKILIQEGRSTLITAIRNFCEYFNSQEECAFCAINFYARGRGGVVQKSPQQIAETVEEATRESSGLTLDLTSGNTFTSDHGAQRYFDVICAVRRVSNIPICVELAPPDSDETLEQLAQLGVNAFLMNLEIYDERLRRLFMPGKSRIPKKRYFDAYVRALQLVGKSMVSSVLIVGLENKHSTLEGAEKLIEIGVIPTIMPLRPNDGSLLENYPTPSPDDVQEISMHVGRWLIAKQLDPLVHPGCISCMACSTEADHLRIATERKADRLLQ